MYLAGRDNLLTQATRTKKNKSKVLNLLTKTLFSCDQEHNHHCGNYKVNCTRLHTFLVADQKSAGSETDEAWPSHVRHRKVSPDTSRFVAVYFPSQSRYRMFGIGIGPSLALICTNNHGKFSCLSSNRRRLDIWRIRWRFGSENFCIFHSRSSIALRLYHKFSDEAGWRFRGHVS